ncbi:MAG: hypothetical protein M3O30_18850 [Planctomycetota bacterium]|nr:hypothetical protein [Planctomycetota bacterium]
MNRKHGTATYTTHAIADRQAGSAGLELYRETNGKTERAAHILFWDATGQFGFQTFNVEIPLDIVEELIAEVKAAVKTE